MLPTTSSSIGQIQFGVNLNDGGGLIRLKIVSHKSEEILKLRCTLEEDRTQIINFGSTENIVSAKIEMCDKLSFPVYI